MSMKFDIQRRSTVFKFENIQNINKAKQSKIDHKNRAYSEKKLNKQNKMMNSISFFRLFKLQQIMKNDIKIYHFVNTLTAFS